MLGMSTFAATFIGIAVFAQYNIKKRLKKQDGWLKPTLQWMAWVCGLLGGTAAAPYLSKVFGLFGGKVAAFAIVGSLIVLAVDIVDKKPDWRATVVAIVVPSFIYAVGGEAGPFFEGLLTPFSSTNAALAVWFGF
jgi:hypothetical protein